MALAERHLSAPGDSRLVAEVPLGKGQVDMRAFLATLKEIGYYGPLTIEREIPQDRKRQKAEIQHATELLSQLRKELLGPDA